jgi:hypothetical protein
MKNLQTKFSGAQVSKQIKKELTEAFKNIKFSVRYSSYSGGNSIRVTWSAGPTVSEVEKITGKFQSGYFDGMQDMYIHENTTIIDDSGTVANLGGVDYVFTDREFSEEFKNKAIDKLCKITNVEYYGNDTFIKNYNEYASTLIYRLLRKQSFKTENPEFLDIFSLPLSGCFEDVYKISVSEIIEDQEVKTDIAKIQVEALKAELKDMEARFYAKCTEATEYSNKYYNLLDQIRREKSEAIKPYIIDLTDKRIFLTDTKYANLNKNSTIEEYEEEVNNGSYYVRKSKINGILHLTDSEYEFLENNLMENYSFLAGYGGSDSDYKLPEEITEIWKMNEETRNAWMAESYNIGCLIYHPTKPLFFIDTQGYNYARYVALIPEETQVKLRGYIESL